MSNHYAVDKGEVCRTILLMSSYNSQDGGFLYAQKQTRFLFDDFELLVLSQQGGVLGVVTELYLGRFWTRLRRNFIFPSFDSWVLQKLVGLHARRFLSSGKCKSVERLVCVSGHYLSLPLAAHIKKERPHTVIHFSVLDLPWTFRSSLRYRNYLKDLFIREFTSCVDSADFTTVEMRDIFVRSGFLGPSLVTYSAIEVVVGDYSQVREPLRSNLRSERKIVIAGGVRASKEILKFADAYIGAFSKSDGDVGIDLYGPNSLRHSAIRYLGFRSDSDLKGCLANYKLGLIAMSFSDSDALLVQTSFPGKAWLYLENGIVPIVFAPENAGISALIRREKMGINLTLEEDLDQTLMREFSDLAYDVYMQSYISFKLDQGRKFHRFREKIFDRRSGEVHCGD